MKLLLKFFFIVWCGTSVGGVFTEDELEVILSALKLFKIGECILSSEVQDETARGGMKKFGKSFISTGFIRVDLLGEEIRIKSKPPNAPTAIVVEAEKPGVLEKLLVKNFKRLHWFVWFLTVKEDWNPEIKIPYNCQLFLIQKDSFRTHRLIEVFHIKNSSARISEFGSWTPEKGLKTSSVSLYKRRRDLNGVELEITVCNEYKANEEMQIFWKDTARLLNFSLKMEYQKLKKTPSGYVFPSKPDGSTCVWGITGIDFEEDWLFLSFGNKVKLTTKFRGTNEVGWKAYVQPFTGEMWMVLGFWLLLSTAAIVIVNGPTKKSLYLNAFTAFYCLCSSDPTVIHPPDDSISTSTKLVYLMSLAVPAVIIPAYSAYILSSVSVILPLKPFNDIKGFIADGTYRLAGVENTFILRNLRNSEDPELKYIYENLFVGDEDLAPTFRAFFEQLCKNNKLAGLFIDHKSFRALFQCQMFVMHQEVSTVSVGVLLQKGSPLRKVLNERLAEYHEKGIKYRTSVPSVHIRAVFEEETESLNSLNISQMKAIFLLLPVGALLSLVVLVVEIIVKKRSNRDPGEDPLVI